MEFSKKLMVFACVLVAFTFFTTFAAWVFEREPPNDLIGFATWFSAPIVAYMAKSAYENKAKIESGVDVERKDDSAEG
jgi:hypothetical protein